MSLKQIFHQPNTRWNDSCARFYLHLEFERMSEKVNRLSPVQYMCLVGNFTMTNFPIFMAISHGTVRKVFSSFNFELS